MQPIVKVQRLGLTVLLGLEEEVASMDDLLHFLAQHAKDAVKRLEEAAYHVVSQADGAAGQSLVTEHKTTYSHIFKRWVKGGAATAEEILMRPNRKLPGVALNLPLYTWRKNGKYILAEGAG
ncbi:hypothetical protein CLOM_g6443 [Closterium sp. NIES-68]|nr:hypothetical protein CLOM_g6443 [Closterium sp. NIES-68]GJP67884.1 hypothetical protein CLOP_g24643 [Closterium sp. NIES-67]